jgi:acetoin utilization protein AcuB
MTREVATISPETLLPLAWATLQRLRVRHLPVVVDGKLVGIISDRDLLVRGTRGADGSLVLPETAIAGEVMSLRPITCRANAPVSTLAALMLEHRIDALPITDAHDGLLGLVTSTDLLELLKEPEQVSEVLPFSYQLRKANELMDVA